MLVVDLGFSSAKWLYGDKKGTVRSCYRRTKTEEGILFKGDRYLVGSKALIETGSHYLRTVDELVEMYPLFVAVCADKAGIEHDDFLVVGLPYDFWKEENLKLKKGQDSEIELLTKLLSDISANSKSYKFKNVLIFPQGLGGIKKYLSQNDLSGNVLAIDIGFNTVIYTLYNIDEGEIIAGNTFYKKGLHDLAVHMLLPEIRRHIKGKTLTPIEVDYVMRTGYIQHGFDRIDVTPEIRSAMGDYLINLFELVIGDLKAHGGVITFETILLFGGGSRLIKSEITAEKVQIVTLEEPEFANCEGFKIRAEEIINAL